MSATGDKPIDDGLAHGIGRDAAEALSDTARMLRRSYSLDRWLVNGRSRAPVAVVFEHDDRLGRSRRLVLKVPAVDGSDPVETEYARHRSAYDEAPEPFAQAHLTRPEHDPIRVGPGRWITFQGIAGDDAESVEVLTTVLNAVLGAGEDLQHYDDAVFAAACSAVVRGVLEGWNSAPRALRNPVTTADFLHLHLHDQLEPGGRLHAMSRRLSGDTVDLPGEASALPNPFALARGGFLGDARIIRTIVGRAHGDLHSDNILIRVRPNPDPDDFHLIDLALYEREGPLTRDPMHMLLYVLARRMDHLAPPQQQALIAVLLDPVSAPRTQLPNWLGALVDAVEGTAARWLAGSGLQPEWRAQRLLSLAGCSMLFLGRSSTRVEDHEWFLRLAARATAAFLALNTKAVPASTAALARGRAPGLPWRRVEHVPSAPRLPLGPPSTAGRLWLQISPVDATQTYQARDIAALQAELVQIGRDSRLFTQDETPETTEPASAVSTDGAGIVIDRDGRCAVWTALPHDPVGAVLDQDDLIARFTVLLSAAAGVGIPGNGETFIQAGVDARDPMSEGRVADLPRTRMRGWSSRAPIAVVVEDSLPVTAVSARAGEVAAELTSRVLAAFRAGDGSVPRVR